MSRGSAAAAALVLALAGSAAAQAPPKKGAAYAPPEPPVLRWEVTLGGAGGFGVAKDDVEAAFIRAGYASVSASGDFLSATFYPTIRYRIGETISVGISASSTKLGSTSGGEPGTTVTLQRSSADVALLAFWRPLPILRMGGGPAWYRLTASPAGGDDLEVSKPGWIAEAGFAGPEGSRVYGDLGIQYRGTGSADFGTYQPPARGISSPAPVSLDGISCAHWALVVGVGFRF